MNTPRLGRDITAALLFKLLLLTALYLVFFRTDAQPTLDGAAISHHLFGADATSGEDGP